MAETSDGQRQLVSSSLPSLSSHPEVSALITRSMETTKELWKDGGRLGVETDRQIWSSTKFTRFWAPRAHTYTRDMSPAKIIWPTAHPEVYTPPAPFLLPNIPIPPELHHLITDFNSELLSTESEAHQGRPAVTQPKPHRLLLENKHVTINAEMDCHGEEFFPCLSCGEL